MIVELYRSGKKAQDISKEFEVLQDLIYRWNRELFQRGEQSFPGNGKTNLTAEQKEIERLSKELREAQLERDILKKAVSIFSRKDNKYSDS